MNKNLFVKFIAKPNTWFKENTECLWEDSNFVARHPSLKEYEDVIKKDGAAVFAGIRVCEDNPNENSMGCTAGDEREDGEWCGLDEFDVEIFEL